LLESRDEYTAEGVFWIPPEAWWQYLQERAKQPGLGKLIDNAMDLIEIDYPSLRGVLPKTFARPSLDVRRLGELVDLISGIGLGAAERRYKDVLGREPIALSRAKKKLATIAYASAVADVLGGEEDTASDECRGGWQHCQPHRASAAASCLSRPGIDGALN
jgi:type I restriction-modification system DNA methylase subunit